MKKIIARLSLIFLTLFLINSEALAKETRAVSQKPKIYKLDLDNDGLKEIIKIDNQTDSAGGALITITRRDKSEVVSIPVPGHFKRVEFVDLNEDGSKQMAVYSQGEGGDTSLVIYKLKEDKLSKLFDVQTDCGIETEFKSVLGRIKVGQPEEGQKDCSSGGVSRWQEWVWGGEKFVREK